MDAQPNSINWLAHLTNDEIIDQFNGILQSLSFPFELVKQDLNSN